MKNGNQQNQNNDAIFLTPQFDQLDLATPEGYKHALTAHTFRCEHEGCDAEGTADATLNVVYHRGKKVRAALFSTFQMKVEDTVKDRRTGNPIIDRDTGTVVTRDKVVLRQILCRKHAEMSEPAAKKAGFQVKVYPLPANLDFLRRMGQDSIQRDLAKEFFLALIKGEKSIEDGMKAGFITALPPEGEETKPDRNGDLPNILAHKGQMVGLVSGTAAKSYHNARKANTELFSQSGYYLYWCTMSQAKALAEEHAANQAKWLADQAEREADNKRRAEARAEAVAASNNLFAGLAKRFGLKAEPSAPKGGDRRRKERDRRDDPKSSKPEVTPAAADQIAEELSALDTEVVVPTMMIEEEEPRGSQPPTLTASLGSLATSRSK